MSLEQEIEDTKKKLAEIEEKEETSEEVTEDAEKTPEEPEQEKKEQEGGEEEKKEEVKEEKPDDAAFARLRREAAANKKRADDAEAKLKAPKEEAEAEEIPPVITHMINDFQTKQAEREFEAYEARAKASNPEYEAISQEYTGILMASLKALNPKKSNYEIGEMTKRTLLEKARDYALAGFENPVEEIFHEAKTELKLTGKKAEVVEKEEKQPTPDMKKLAENRKRNAGTAGTSGESKQGLSRKNIADNGVTMADWAKLSLQEKRELMQSA